MRSVLSLLVGATFVAASSVAGAQDISGSVPGSGSSQTVSGGSITDTSGPTDHSIVVNRMGLRYFGPTSLAALGDNGMAGGSGTLHTVGARYWLSPGLAIEGGLGFGFRSGGRTTTTTAGAGTTNTSADIPNFFGIGAHIALPIMMAEAKHLVVHFDPFLSLHYGRSAITTTPSSDEQNDTTLNALRLTLGANATAEVQFGFLGIPQLGLQASLGVALAYQSGSMNTVRTTTRAGQQPRTETTVSESLFTVGTTVGPQYGLADIITGSISAVYYFGNAPSR
jgi:hypothetical protein